MFFQNGIDRIIENIGRFFEAIDRMLVIFGCGMSRNHRPYSPQDRMQFIPEFCFREITWRYLPAKIPFRIRNTGCFHWKNTSHIFLTGQKKTTNYNPQTFVQHEILYSECE